MLPPDLLAIDLGFESGRPTRVSLHLRGGLRLEGISVWRTPGGPRVVFPTTRGPGPSSHQVFRIPPSLRREWIRSIVEAWRSRIGLAVSGLQASPARRAA